MLSCHYDSLEHPWTLIGSREQYPFLVYNKLLRCPTFYLRTPASLRAYCFNLTYLANIASLWLLLPRPSTNLSKTDYILINLAILSVLSLLLIRPIILDRYYS